MKCPECKEPMAEQSLEGRTGEHVRVDVCHGCRGLWFDTNESRQLSAAGTLKLFREMHGQPVERRPRDTRGMSCPRCDAKLALAHDLAHNNRFHSSRCPKGDGHFITFFHFLREKGIARSLTPRELTELRKHVDTLLCSDCGEPVRLANLTACVRCEAPLSLLDPDCVRNTVSDAQRAAGSRRDVAPEVAARLLMDNLKTASFHPKAEHPKAEHRSNAIPPVELPPVSSEARRATNTLSAAMDLISEGIGIVVGIFF